MGRIKIFSLTLNSATIYNNLNLKYLIPDLHDLAMEVPLPPSKISHLLFYSKRHIHEDLILSMCIFGE
jgi:hypothetical protein